LLDAHDHHEHGHGCGCAHDHDHDHDHEQQLKAMKEPAMKVEGVRNADMWIVFTCTKCETRSIKGMTRHAYEKGIVIVRCGGCDVLHLIADNIGWFPEDDIHPQESKVHNIERMLSAKGEIVRRVTQDGLVSLSPEELAEIQKLATSSSAAAAGSSPSS
jgi:protein import protein ZIM17